MTMSEGQLRELFEQAQSMPDGPAKFQALDIAIRHADAAGDTRLAFEFRHESIEAFTFGGDDRRAFLAFSQSLAAYDRDPTLADEYSEHSMLWQFKWIVNALPDFPEIPLERTYAVLEDMQSRYLRGGYSLHAVHQARWQIAIHVGDLETAARSYQDMVTAKADSLANCSVCVPSARTRYLSDTGQYEEAVKVGGPKKRGWCRRQPRWIQAQLMLPYLCTGRYAEAAEAQRNSYRQMRTDHTDIAGIGLHLTFLGRSGNETRGLELVEKHLPWLEVAPTPADALQFSPPAVLVLNRLSANGFGEVKIRGRQRTETTVDALRAELTEFTRELAARFDARNGNSYQSELAEAKMTAASVADHVSLSVIDSLGTKKKGLVALKERITEQTLAGNAEGAARARLAAATQLAKSSDDEAYSAAEEAALALERAGLTTELREARLLLWSLYRQASAHHDSAKQVLELLLPEAERGEKARLLEESSLLYWGEERAERLIAAADLYKDDGQADAELRVVVRAMAAGDDLSLLDRAESLRTNKSWPLLVGPIAEILAYSEQTERALGYALEAVTLSLPRKEHKKAVRLLCRLLLAANRPAEAETHARAYLSESPDKKHRAVRVLLARALRAQGPDSVEAAEIVATYDVQEWELSQPDDDDEGD